MGGSRSLRKKYLEENRPMGRPTCVFCLSTLLNVVSHYDLSILSKLLMVSKKGWMGWVSGMNSLSSFFWDFRICLTLQNP